MTIYFNNSSLPTLKCPRRFVLQNVHGLKFVKPDHFRIGSVFHHYMRVIEPSDSAFTLTLFPNKKAPDHLTSTIRECDVTRLADLAVRASQLMEPNETAVREQFFSFDSTSLIQTPFDRPADTQVLDAGTLDRLELVSTPLGKFAMITDYKTTHTKLNSGDFHVNYKLQSQFLFYGSRLRYAARTGQLPEVYKPFEAELADSRIMARHLFVNHTDKAAENPQRDQLMLCQPSILPVDQLDEFDNLFAQERDLAVFLHTRPELSPKKGMMNGSCYGCPFQQICLLANPKLEAEAIERWPLGRAPYDPRHTDEA